MGRLQINVYLFAKTGIRRQELIDLDLKDLYLENRYAILKPHAKRSNRVVFFDNECAQVLEAWLSWRQENKIRNKALFLGTHAPGSTEILSMTSQQNTPKA
ncbi:site-specific integrase [Methanosarcina horonobensis]|uniref:site-specific integrase n=1 Tax=Methanosarcina horonobensis TaxID=418008 RepID=UPI000A878A0C|nr:site-specific integrase [Methanosarcina horonobensis]